MYEKINEYLKYFLKENKNLAGDLHLKIKIIDLTIENK
jgi:hypothetical protein